MTKTEFASKLGVGKSAVSNWIERGIISGDGIVGTGRRAKINAAIAAEQVRRNRDIGQSLGNGIATRTSVDQSSPARQPSLPIPDAEQEDASQQEDNRTSAPPVTAKIDSVEDQLKRAKLEEQLRRNRIQAADEALRQDKLMSTKDVREQMTRIAGMMLQIFEGAWPDFASAMAAQFDLPQRDALHLLRSEFKNVRRTAMLKERGSAGDTEKGMTTRVESDA